jgi:hypothetical protein
MPYQHFGAVAAAAHRTSNRLMMIGGGPQFAAAYTADNGNNSTILYQNGNHRSVCKSLSVSTCLPVRPHVTTRRSLDGFS